MLSAFLLIQGEVENAVREEQTEALSRILCRKGIGNAPHDAFEKVVCETGNFSVGLKHLQDALRLDPSNPQYNAEMALYFAFLVSRQANSGLQANPTMIASGKEYAKRSLTKGGYKTVAHVALGMLFDNEGLHKEAQRCFKKAGKLGEPWHHIYLCTSYGMAGDFDKALKEIEQHNDENLPDVWVVHLHRGRTLLRAGRYREAEAELRTAIERRGAYPGLALSLAESIYMQGRFLAANRYKMREVILLLPVNPKLSIRLFTEVMIHSAIYVLAAGSRAVTKRFANKRRLVHILSRIIIIPPFEPYATLSEMAFKQGHMTEAYDLLQQALEFGGHEAWLWANLAAVSLVMGHHSEASAACARAQELEPENPAWQQQADAIQAMTSGTAPLRMILCTQKKGENDWVELPELRQISTDK